MKPTYRDKLVAINLTTPVSLPSFKLQFLVQTLDGKVPSEVVII